MSDKKTSDRIKILVTGANGLLGQKIIYGYRFDPEIQLIATGRGDCRMHERDGYIYESMDISDPSDVERVIGKYYPDCIINAAAMTNVDACELDHEGCDLANVKAVEILAEQCAKHNIHLIQLSTDFIFDGKDGPYSEEAEPSPLSYYGHSKLDAEKIVKCLKKG